MIELTPLDWKEMTPPELPEDVIIFSNEPVEPSPVMDITADDELIAMIREAKEKHHPAMIMNDDETRAIVFKDINDIKGAISFNGIPLMKL